MSMSDAMGDYGDGFISFHWHALICERMLIKYNDGDERGKKERMGKD